VLWRSRVEFVRSCDFAPGTGGGLSREAAAFRLVGEKRQLAMRSQSTREERCPAAKSPSIGTRSNGLLREDNELAALLERVLNQVLEAEPTEHLRVGPHQARRTTEAEGTATTGGAL